MSLITSKSTRPSLLRPKTLANGTIPSRDLARSRRFYEQVLGLEVADHPAGGLVIRLGGEHTYLVEEHPEFTEMVLLNHNGLYLRDDESVDEAYRKLVEVRAEYEIRQITKPMWQHGSYAFFMVDRDGNWWEFYHAPKSARQDLTGGPPMTPDQAREWFRARRAAAGGDAA